jgi:DNA-binding NarL/FixJ family response regulator
MNLACNILHLEDDDNDSLFFHRALTRSQFVGAYRRVSTVEAVIEYLKGLNQFADRKLFPHPDVLVMDSAMAGGPSIDALLTWLDERKQFRRLVRLMLTGGVSKAKSDEWLEQGVAAVLLKGASVDELALSVQEVLRRCVR